MLDTAVPGLAVFIIPKASRFQPDFVLYIVCNEYIFIH